MNIITKICVLLLWAQTLTFVKCQEVQCDVPVIEHGSVAGGRQQYKENEVLNFKCDPSYRPTDERNSRCMKAGTSAEWIPTPGCKQIQCELTPLEGITYRPQNKNLFLPREKVQITCGERYYILDRKKTSADITCKDDGEWNINPACLEVTCPNSLPNENLYSSVWTRQNKLDDTVGYNCRRNYERTDGVRHATCTRDGWTPKPLCRALSCGEPDLENAEITRGKRRSYGHGDEVTYRCLNRDQKFFTATCDRGTWTGNNGCSEVQCDVPVIEHGSVAGGRQQYKENEVLNFKCDPSYKPTDERNSRCMKAGTSAEWIPTPGCKQIQCELTPLEGITYRPQNKNLFLPREKVQITCGERYYILDRKKTSADITCKEDGEWNINPACLEVTCPNSLPNENLYSSVWTRQNKLDDTVGYNCRRNYERTDGVRHATCTRDGWTPKPLCRALSCGEPDLENAEITRGKRRSYGHGDEVTYRCLNRDQKSFTATCDRGTWTGNNGCSGVRPCIKPDIQNGFAVGPFNNTVYFSCNEDYKFSAKSWWGEAKCNDGVWSGLQTCIENTMCGEAPEFPNGRMIRKKPDGQPEKFNTVCNEGYRAGTEQVPCRNGVWDLEALKTFCSPISELCSPPPKVMNTIIKTPYQNTYLSDSSVTYECRERYKMEGDGTIMCRDGNWEKKNITCIPYCEKLQDLKLTIKSSTDKEIYDDGDVIEYVCNAPDTIHEGSATCVNSKWNKTVECPALSCEIGTLTTGLKISGFPPKDNRVKAGNKLRFFCIDNYDMEGSKETECLETGQWKDPFPTCSEQCSVPEIPDNLRISPSGAFYLSKGASITFECRERGYFTEGNEKIECLGNKQWSGAPPTCEKKCKVPTLTENVLISPPAQGNAVRPGQTLTFTCSNDGLSIQGNSKIECLEDGQWNGPPPTCGGSVCRNPPLLEDGDTVEIIKSEYQHNERVKYMCQNRYTMDGVPFKTCTRGVWTGEMRCLKPCTVDTEKMDRHHIQFAYGYENKLYPVHNDHITFACKGWKRQVSSGSMRKICIDGEMELPSCQ